MLLTLHADARPQSIILPIALLFPNETWMDLQALIVPHNTETISPWTCEAEVHAGRRRGARRDSKQEALESPFNHSSKLHQVCTISAANACGGMGNAFLFTVTLGRTFLGPLRLFKRVLTVTGAGFPSLPLSGCSCFSWGTITNGHLHLFLY